jgi:hypothetical protein
MTRQESIDVLWQRVVLAMHERAADLAGEQRRRAALEREVRRLRSQMAEVTAREVEHNVPAQPNSD